MKGPKFASDLIVRLREKAPAVANLHRSIEGNPAAVALTFDDGPDPIFTPQVLDVLASHDVLATFFLVGSRATDQAGLIRRMIDDGHAVGSHSMTHPDPKALSIPRIAREYRSGRRSVERVVGRAAPLFRPPQGVFNLKHATVMRALGLRTWLWNKDPKDWMPGSTVESILAGIGVPEPGDVVLLHDAIESPTDAAASDRSSTVAALPQIIDRVRQRGLGFVTLR
jgi:peptidoglycan/xylan/chitin deacetylase (PgdA/CDA1 family)